MKRMLLGLSMVAAMLFAASAALAGGLNLAWNNCASEGGVPNRTSTCLVNTGSNQMTGSFVPNEDINGVTGIECVLDIIAGDGTSTIPDWWDMTAVTGCRNSSINANGTVNGANSVCNDWANGLAAGGLAAYTSSGVQGVSPGEGSVNPANAAAHRRIIIGFAVANGQNVLANNEYFAFNCLINNQKTVGTGLCAGCSTPVCIVLNSINVVPGTNPGHLIATGTTAGSNFATWQGSGPNCALVPTKNVSWGTVKSLYH